MAEHAARSLNLDMMAYGLWLLFLLDTRHRKLRGEVNEVHATDGKPQSDGRPTCIRRLRIPVATVVGMVADGMREDEILEAFPDLEHEDIGEALRYAAEAVRERELPEVAWAP